MAKKKRPRAKKQIALRDLGAAGEAKGGLLPYMEQDNVMRVRPKGLGYANLETSY